MTRLIEEARMAPKTMSIREAPRIGLYIPETAMK